MAGVLGAGAACPFFSSEKSCVITSKKLLSGLPGYTEQRQREEEKGKRKNGEKEEGMRKEKKRKKKSGEMGNHFAFVILTQ